MVMSARYAVVVTCPSAPAGAARVAVQHRASSQRHRRPHVGAVFSVAYGARVFYASAIAAYLLAEESHCYEYWHLCSLARVYD